MRLNGKWLCHYGVKGMKWDEKKTIDSEYQNELSYNSKTNNYFSKPKSSAGMPTNNYPSKPKSSAGMPTNINTSKPKTSTSQSASPIDSAKREYAFAIIAAKKAKSPSDIVAAKKALLVAKQKLIEAQRKTLQKSSAGMPSNTGKPLKRAPGTLYKMEKDGVSASEEYWEELGYNSKKNR